MNKRLISPLADFVHRYFASELFILFLQLVDALLMHSIALVEVIIKLLQQLVFYDNHLALYLLALSRLKLQ